MIKQLQGKVAIVTGASSGIGKCITETYAMHGAKMVLAARRKELLDAIVADIAAAGGEALAVPTELTQEDDVATLFARTVEAYGRLDVLVNNAGVAASAPTEDISLAAWKEVLDINLTAAFLCSREALKIMKSQTPQGGRIINIGSVSAKAPRPDSLAYTATKFAIHGMTHQLTMDGRKYNVVASVLHPGMTFSSFTMRHGRTEAGPGETPSDYLMAPEDVAKVALLMASLPPEVNLFEATILPNHMPSFIGRG